MKKKISTFITIMISIIAVYTILWFANSQLVFSKYETDGFQASLIGGGNSKLKEVNQYVLNVKKPDYGSFTGNLGITGQHSNISIIIWPSLLKDTKYSLIIEDGKETSQFDVDENFSPLDKNNIVAQQLIEKYEDELQKQRKILHEAWGIFEDDVENEKN